MTRNAIRYSFYAACYTVLVDLVVLPWIVGMEPMEFWRW